jgi:23S rRNA (cytidine1920-2'-O)/16S rRNA (cytidine1409-2'-O)-methyltransferase
VETRERAQALILSGSVLVDEKKIDKAGKRISTNAELRLLGKEIPYVSRGGLKLEKALEALSISVDNKIVLDVGASTGGFADCLLQKGAKKIYTVDVGYGQLAWKLRKDPRIVVIERQNIRTIPEEAFEDELDVATIDVSFISLKIVLPKVWTLIRKEGEILALLKPQFEVGKGEVGKGGIVKDPGLHKRVILEIENLAAELGLNLQGRVASPILGAKGNREFFLYWKA